MTGPIEAMADHSGDWTLITVTYNSAHHLRESWTSAQVGDARWVVVDNASNDNSVTVAESLDAEVIRLPENVGFARANNAALERVTTPWVAFLNPDVTVASPADLTRLAAVSLANEGSLVAPQLINPDGSEQANARGLPFLIDKVAHRGLKLPGARLTDYARTGLSGPTFVAWVMGAALAGPTDVFRRLGGWDERFFIYYEDHDIGLRAWEAGTRVVVDPAVRWVHEWQRATTGARLTPWKHEIRSGKRFYSKYPELLGRGFAVHGGRPLERLGEASWSAAADAP
jgi:GT2 family glycosyltransferase